MKRLLVTGSRHADPKGVSDPRTIKRALKQAIKDLGDQVTLVHGGAAGVDSICAELFGRLHPAGWVEAHPVSDANWAYYGGPAGPKRNEQMVLRGADLCLAFPMDGEPNKGTNNCVKQARAEDIPVRVVWL